MFLVNHYSNCLSLAETVGVGMMASWIQGLYVAASERHHLLYNNYAPIPHYGLHPIINLNVWKLEAQFTP